MFLGGPMGSGNGVDPIPVGDGHRIQSHRCGLLHDLFGQTRALVKRERGATHELGGIPVPPSVEYPLAVFPIQPCRAPIVQDGTPIGSLKGLAPPLSRQVFGNSKHTLFNFYHKKLFLELDTLH